MKKETKKYEEIFTKNNFKLISIVFIISSLLITIFSNINMDMYIKKFIIPTFIMIGSYIFIAERIKVVKNRKAYFYLIPIILILISYLYIKIDVSNMVLNVIATILILPIFFLSLVNEKYNVCRRFLVHLFKLFPYKLFSNLDYISSITDVKKNKDKNKNGIYIFIGCIIGIPIGIVMLCLLVGADKYFSSFIDKILGNLIDVIKINNLLPNIIILIIAFIILFSTFVNILKNRKIVDKESKIISANKYIVSTILIIINSVFVLFLISEISKLTVNFLHLPIEYTYAQYAREGFFQLLFITLINISIILYLTYYTNILSNRLVKNLVICLITFSVLLVFNSYYRMFLYIGAYGFTVLRLQVILFLAMELLLFFLILDKIAGKIKYNEAFIIMIIIMITYVLNVYMCSDTFINLIS